MTVAALVVSHNRSHLLRRCLTAIEAQTRPLDEILLVDNHSTDDSVDMVRREFPSVTVVTSAANIGGAGGFSRGIDILLGRGHSYAWLMDDDAEPRPDALEPLVTAMETAEPHAPGFVASTVLAPDGTDIPSHVPLRIPEAENRGLTAPAGTYPAAHCTFVGALINLEVARETFLPIADFFIWWDDSEYTSRLQTLAGGLASTSSVVVHPRKAEWDDLGPRLRFDVRNRLWILRGRGLASRHGRNRAKSGFVSGVLSQGRNARRKDMFLWYLVRGLVEGVLRRPRLARPGTTTQPQLAGAASSRVS
jgi:glycosyltransferase involved in cell wall biosynthesis